MKNLSLLLILLVTVSCKSKADPKITIIELETLKTEVIGKDLQLVDVRTPDEYNAGHIDDAININIADMDTFVAEFEKLDKSKPVYVYCKLGGRSKRASKKLEEMGFMDIYDFSGGYTAWSNQ